MEALTREFVPRYPEIKLEISITDRHVDLIREGYDVAQRVGEMGNVDWMVRRLATLPPIVVAAPQWLERVAHRATREALARLPHLRDRLGSPAYPTRLACGTDLLPKGAPSG